MTGKTLLILLILSAMLFSASMAVFSESHDGVRVFEHYDLENGQYAVVGTFWGNQGHRIVKELGEFYADDVKTLSELKRKWITDEPSPFFACGYHYSIYVMKDGEEVDSFRLNLERGCNTIVMDRGSYYFDPDLLDSFIGTLKRPVKERKTFETLEQGRAYIKSISGRSDLLMIIDPEWREHDGEFRFYAQCDFGNYDHERKQHCVDRIDRHIKKKYPGEKFKLDETGSQGNKILVEMKCSKGLHDKFDLYEAAWKWQGYSPSLTVYWKRVPKQQ